MSLTIVNYYLIQPPDTFKGDIPTVTTAMIWLIQSLILVFLASMFSKKLRKEKIVKNYLQLKESELNKILNTVYEFIVLTDENGYIVEVNSAYLNFQPDPSIDITGKSIYDTFPWKNNISLGVKLRDLFDNSKFNGSHKLDEQLRIHNQKYYYELRVSKIVFDVPKGRVLFAVSGIDITERKIYERQLEDVQKSYTKLIDSNIIGMTISDGHGNIIDANNAFLKMIGHKQQDISNINLRWLDLIPEEYVTQYNKSMRSLMLKGFSDPTQKELRRTNGTKIPVLISRVLIDEQKNRILTLTVDLTYQQKIITLKDEFVGIITHELKTPLMTLKGYIDMLNEQVTDQQKKMVSIVSRQTDKLNKLVMDLIEFTKISKGSLELKYENFDIVSLCKRISKDMGLIDSSHKFVVKANAKKIEIRADSYRLEQVITNFLTNSIKFSQGKDKIILEIQESAQSVKVSVIDFGFGIQKEDLNKVFNKFFQAQSQPEVFQKSLGLGLYISSEIVKKHKGKIGVKSEPGKETTFFFIIPKE